MTTPTSEILNKAADLIEQKGWGQGAVTWDARGGRGLCLEGAIGAALGRSVNGFGGFTPDELNFECPAGLAVRAYLDMKLTNEDSPTWLCHWNDSYARTAEQVIEVLRATALIEQARENSSVTEKVSA